MNSCPRLWCCSLCCLSVVGVPALALAAGRTGGRRRPRPAGSRRRPRRAAAWTDPGRRRVRRGPGDGRRGLRHRQDRLLRRRKHGPAARGGRQHPNRHDYHGGHDRRRHACSPWSCAWSTYASSSQLAEGDRIMWNRVLCLPVGRGDRLGDCRAGLGRRSRRRPTQATSTRLARRPGSSTWPSGPPWSSSACWRFSGSSPGSRSWPGPRQAGSTASPTRSPRPRPPTSRPRNCWPSTSGNWPPPGDEVRGILDQGRRDAEQLGRELLDKAKQEAKAEQQRAAAGRSRPPPTPP